MSNKRSEWIIIVAQEVKGKSKFPHKKVGKFIRYKPWFYSNIDLVHKIIYARTFLSEVKPAVEKAQQVKDEMFLMFVMGMGNLKTSCVMDITVSLHNVTTNSSILIGTTFDGIKSSEIYPGILVNNHNLKKWGILK